MKEKQTDKSSGAALTKLLLRKNVSPARVAGFILSNFIGLAIILAGLQFYSDARALWEDEDSFIKKDYLVVNKRVTSENTLGSSSSEFTATELRELEQQPWVRSVGCFTPASYRVSASVGEAGRTMSTAMFFESIPDAFVDAGGSRWRYREGSSEVPVIIPKDYLTLYNFGFATSAGLPQLSEQLMGAVPLRLTLTSEDGGRGGVFEGRVVGFSNRLNTILVPESFMAWSNARFGVSGAERGVSRVIIDVSSPGDVAIQRYLEERDLETAGDKSASRASYLLRVVTGVILAVGVVITLLSFFILLLSVSLLMEKSRDKLHTLLELGYPLRAVGAPYRRLVVCASLLSLALALVAVWLLRRAYIGAVVASAGEGTAGAWWPVALTGCVLTALIVLFSCLSVRRRVAEAW